MLVINYALGLEVIHRARSELPSGSDSGAKSLDLSSIPEQNIAPDTFDLTTFSDSARLLPSLGAMSKVLVEIDRLTKPTGLVMAMDLVRLKTSQSTEKYIDFLAENFIHSMGPEGTDYFKNSMYSAWTAKEFASTIPQSSRRNWCHIVPHGFPIVQIILGLPVGRKQVFVRDTPPWTDANHPVPDNLRMLWRIARFALFSGTKKIIPAKLEAELRTELDLAT